jgi:hypothetical protein
VRRCVIASVRSSQAGATPLDERVVGNVYHREDLIIWSDVLMAMPRKVLTVIHRQTVAHDQLLIRDAMFGHMASRQLIAFIKAACERAIDAHTYERLMPSTTLQPDTHLGDSRAGLWNAHENR